MPELTQATIITGANRGIGRAIARRMAKETVVVLVGRDEPGLKALCTEILEQSPETSLGVALYCAGDITDPETAKRAVAALPENTQLQNLICNAGISKAGATARFPEKSWRELFDVNVHGTFNFVKECLPRMLEQKSGNICFLAGSAGLQGYRSMAGYCASKHALVGFARALAPEVSSSGVNVVPICPGPVDTDMTAVFINSMVSRGMTREAACAKIAEGSNQTRLLTAEEVADVVALVCGSKTAASQTLEGCWAGAKEPGEPVTFKV